MDVFIDRDGSVEGFSKIIDQAVRSGAKSLLILSCDGNGFEEQSLSPLLRTIPIPIIGGIFPLVLHEQEQMERGTVVLALDTPSEVHYIDGLSDPEADYETILDETIGDDDDIRTLILFVDGLSTRIGAFIDSLYTIFGLEMNYVGGGAGSLTLKKKPCIITNTGLQMDGVILATYPMASGVGVSHGWQTVSGPYKVTKAEHNVVKSLDWRPALEVYREAVEEHGGGRFDTNNFFEIAKAYPFGIARMESERVVRDILTLNDEGHLECVAEVPEGEYVDILNGNTDDLINAAGQAHDKAMADFPAEKMGAQLFMDCISRVLFMQKDFAREVAAATSTSVPSVGACTIGEIANSGNDYLEFYNKTAVVAYLEEQ